VRIEVLVVFSDPVVRENHFTTEVDFNISKLVNVHLSESWFFFLEHLGGVVILQDGDRLVLSWRTFRHLKEC